MATKAEKRLEFKSLLKLKVQDRNSLVPAFALQLERFLKNEKGSWAAFRPLPEEPPITACLQNLNHIHWCYPKVKDSHLEFFHPQETGWTTHSLGMEEPVSGDFVETQSLQGFLIPGLAFSQQGHRLGRGKGYYDRTLSEASGIRVGVCYDMQVTEEIGPLEKHDLKMDYLITEKKIYSFLKSERA